jgi:hypothetical protein
LAKEFSDCRVEIRTISFDDQPTLVLMQVIFKLFIPVIAGFYLEKSLYYEVHLGEIVIVNFIELLANHSVDDFTAFLRHAVDVSKTLFYARAAAAYVIENGRMPAGSIVE